jgi:thymidylate kinase
MSTIIEIAGTSGSGKSTIITELEKLISKEGFEVIKMREPGPLRSLAKTYCSLPEEERSPWTEAAIFATDRLISYQEQMYPKKENKKTIFLKDRGVADSLVYQGIRGGVPIEAILQMNASIPPADLYLCFITEGKTAYEKILERSKKGGEQISISETPMIIDNLADSYKQVGTYLKNVYLIDTTNLSMESATKKCYDLIRGIQ